MSIKRPFSREQRITVIYGMLAFILFKLTVVVFTAVSGSTVAVLGALALLLQVPNWNSSIRSSIATNAIALPLLVLAPAAIGLIFQHAPAGGKGGGDHGGKPAAKAA